MFARFNKILKDKRVTIQTKINLYDVFIVQLYEYSCMEIRTFPL